MGPEGNLTIKNAPPARPVSSSSPSTQFTMELMATSIASFATTESSPQLATEELDARTGSTQRLIIHSGILTRPSKPGHELSLYHLLAKRLFSSNLILMNGHKNLQETHFFSISKAKLVQFLFPF